MRTKGTRFRRERIGGARRWRYCIARRRSAVGCFADRLQTDLGAAGVAESVGLALGVVLDELLANVIMHARDARGPVHLRLRHCKGVLVARLRHAAAPFDPTRADAPDAPASLVEAQVGGVGLALVRAMTSEFLYRHRRGENHIRLTMVTDSAALSAGES